MAEMNRPTVQTAEMIDAHIRQPVIGQYVWALGKGGSVTQVQWRSNSIQFFEAWYPFLKVPESVKKRMSNYFKPKENHE